MGILFFISVFITSCIILFLIGKLFSDNIKEKFGEILLILAIISSFIIGGFSSSIGSDTGCGDGWHSLSIGKKGACSHHGGVVNNLNETGYIIFLFSIIINIISFIIYSNNEKKRKEGENKRIIEEKKIKEELTNKKREEYIKEYNFIKSNKEIINEAKEFKKKIGFDYINNNGEKGYREFLPKTINNTNGTTSGHCFKRNEKRVFSIKKMKNIKIIDESN